MFDYKEQIREFIKMNFRPSSSEDANFKVSSNEFLQFLFQTFPFDCISDYDLNEILLELGFQRFTYSKIHLTSYEDDNGKTIQRQSKSLELAWCLFSNLLDFKEKQ